MPTPNEKLAASLGVLNNLQSGGRRVFQSSEFSRLHRERLLRNGFLTQVIKGWVISSGPGVRPGDSTPCYASFWEFCARYCEARFDAAWHLSPEQSLLLHADKTVIPARVIVSSPKGSNNKIELPFGTSIYDLKEERAPLASDLAVLNGLRLYSAPAALVRVPESFARRHPLELRVVLASVSDVSEILRPLLEGGRSVVAGRLVGALRRIGRQDDADEILDTMKAAGYDVREKDPFESGQATGPLLATAPPIVRRLRAMWEASRESVLEFFPEPPGLPNDANSYLEFVAAIYRSDAYHSLSIEGYRVSPDLLARVAAGDWNPDKNRQDRESRDALAARGYWQAFQLVKRDIAGIISGTEAADLVSRSHRDWHRELFRPCVEAGLIRTAALAGYRTDAVHLRTSRYIPPRWQAVSDAMAEYFDLLRDEREPSVRAVLGHWLFGYIHPYADGNGRMARFLMNAMLASGGYPWTVIRTGDRSRYLAALDSASIDHDVAPFVRLVAEHVRWSIEQNSAWTQTIDDDATGAST